MKYPPFVDTDTRRNMIEALKEQWFNNVLELGDTDKLEEVIEENSDLIAAYFLTYVKKMKGRAVLKDTFYECMNDLGYKLQDMIYRKLDDKAEQEIEWEVNE